MVEPGTTWRSSAPETLLDRPTPYHALWSGRTYDISLDDQRFLMPDYGTTSNSNPGPPRLIVVLNWFEELKRLVPVN